MPGSMTTPGRQGTRACAPLRVAFRVLNSVGTRNYTTIAAQWLARTFPYRRFAGRLAAADARLGVDVARYAFIVVDLHHLLLADLPAHSEFAATPGVAACASDRKAPPPEKAKAPKATATATLFLLGFPLAASFSEAATQAPSASFQMVL